MKLGHLNLPAMSTPRRFSTFMLISLALHLSVILSWPDITEISDSNITTETFFVTMVPANVANQEKVKPDSIISRPRKKMYQSEKIPVKESPSQPSPPRQQIFRNKKKPDYAPLPDSETAPESSKSPNAINTTPTSTSNDDSIHDADNSPPDNTQTTLAATDINDIVQQARDRIILYLSNYINLHKTYPKFARQQGWEGKVLLSFRVEPNGYINSIQIARTSGYAILDKAAIKTLREVGRIPHASLWLRGNMAQLQFSFVYQLSEG